MMLIKYQAPSGGIFWVRRDVMSLLRSYGIFEHGFYKYAAPDGAERRASRVKSGANRRTAGRFGPLSLASARLLVAGKRRAGGRRSGKSARGLAQSKTLARGIIRKR